MIQRIQSLFLFVVAAASASLFFFPMIEFLKPDTPGIYRLYGTGMRYFGDMPAHSFILPLFLIILASLLLAIVTIFLFKKRKMQLLLVNINLLINVILVGLVFLVYTNFFEKQNLKLVTYQFGMYIPLISLVFLVLAARAIRKDEALVKSTDRLR